MARNYDDWKGDQSRESDIRKQSDLLAKITLAAAVCALIVATVKS
jgi:hypothetical protein